MQHWLIIQTRPRWEKKVARRLLEKGIETYCPLIKERRQWSDRVKTLELPLLKSYLFIRIREEQRTLVRLTEGVVNFIYKDGKPVVVKEKLIQAIRQFQEEHPQVKAVVPGKGETVNGTTVEIGKRKAATLRIDTLNILLIGGTLQPYFTELSTDNL